MEVSVIIPVYNAELFVADAIQSALRQPETREVLVTDDGSTDGSLAICRQLAAANSRVRVLVHSDGRNHGPAASRNLGLAAATCQYIALLDADDCFLPDRFRTAREAFAANSEIDGVYDAVRNEFANEELDRSWSWNPTNMFVRPFPPEELFEALVRGGVGCFCTDGLTVRRRVFERTGPFDVDLPGGEDTAMWIKMAASAKLVAGSFSEPVSVRRVHGGNLVLRQAGEYPFYRSRMWERLIQWGKTHRLSDARTLLLIDAWIEQWCSEVPAARGWTGRRLRLRRLAFLCGAALRYPTAMRSSQFRGWLSSLSGWRRLTRRRAPLKAVEEAAKPVSQQPPAYREGPLPEGAERYLRPDNPRLLELKRRLAEMACPAVESSRWSEAYVAHQVPLKYFRGDSAYLYQLRDGNAEAAYDLTAEHLQAIDKLGLWNALDEDEVFGVFAYSFRGNRLISRDLLDSIAEISFLEACLGISRRPGLRVLDIGAGYGRLAHRLVQGLPGLGHVFCVDAIAESTFLCEYYLRFRGVDHKSSAVPLDELEATLAGERIDLAVNIHSFPECTRAAIGWWLDLVRQHRVQHLMIVPNAEQHGGTRLLSAEKDGSRAEFLDDILARGYRLAARRPKYHEPWVQQHGVSPTYYYLFELAGTD